MRTRFSSFFRSRMRGARVQLEADPRSSLRVAHSAALSASSGASQRARNGAATALALARTSSQRLNARRGSTVCGS